MNERRIQIFSLSVELLTAWMSGETFLRVKGIPKGAVVKRAHYDFDRHSFSVVVEHESFPVLPDWCPPLYYPLEIEEAPDPLTLKEQGIIARGLCHVCGFSSCICRAFSEIRAAW